MSCLVLLIISMTLADQSEFLKCDCVALTEKIYSLEKANIQLKKKVTELMGENKGIHYMLKVLSRFIFFILLCYNFIHIYIHIHILSRMDYGGRKGEM